MKLLGNFSSRPEVCCRGARDTRGEHQERFWPGLPIIACPLARPTCSRVGMGHSRSLGNRNAWGWWANGKWKARKSQPLSSF